MEDEEYVTTLANRHHENLKEFKQICAGGIAGCVAKTSVAPLSRVTVLMQVQSMRPHKFFDGCTPNNLFLVASLKKIVREEGFTALWRGNLASMVHRFPYGAITFYGNSKLREQAALWASPDSKVPEAVRGMAASAVSASMGVLACYPLDVVKTRLTAQTGTRYYNGILDALIRIRREEGSRGLYRGLTMTLLSAVPAVSLNFTLYEEFFNLYQDFGLPSSAHALLSGGSSGVVASTVLFPVDLLRRQMQMVGLGGRPAVYNSVAQACRHVFETGRKRGANKSPPLGLLLGCREFFRGLLPELIKVAPNSAINFCVYNELRNRPWPMEPALERTIAAPSNNNNVVNNVNAANKDGDSKASTLKSTSPSPSPPPSRPFSSNSNAHAESDSLLGESRGVAHSCEGDSSAPSAYSTSPSSNSASNSSSNLSSSSWSSRPAPTTAVSDSD